jgi:hypothetical protein
MTGHGGSRHGSGRKAKSERFLGPIFEAEARIADRLPSLIDNLFTLADGVTVEESMPNGGVQVYTCAPDRQANEYLINRIMGKPTERYKHEHDFSGLSDEELIARIQGPPVGGGAAGADDPRPEG